MNSKKIEKLKNEIAEEESFIDGWGNVVNNSSKLHKDVENFVEDIHKKYHDDILMNNGHNKIKLEIEISYNDLWNIKQQLFDGLMYQWDVKHSHRDKVSKLRKQLQKELNK